MCAQSCDPMDCNLPGSSGHGILQTRILERVAISLSRESSQGSNICLLHCGQILYHQHHQGSPYITYIMYLSIYEFIFIHANCHLRGDEENESSYLCMLLLLSRFSHVQLCENPYTAAHQAPLSLGFSRQEHWSEFPFPSPMHECEKWKWSHSVVFDSQRPHGLRPTRLLGPWDFPGKSTGVGCHCLLRVLASTCIILDDKLFSHKVSFYPLVTLWGRHY